MSKSATVVALRPGSRPIEKCKTTGHPDDWHPHEPQASDTIVRDGVKVDARSAYEETARQLCAGCPLIASCLEQALADEAKYGTHAHGIFGGRAPWERDAMRHSAQRRTQRHIQRQAVA